MEFEGLRVSWLGHASFLIERGETRIYIDPYKVGRTRPTADIIFITHDHYDHLSVEDIDTLVSEQTLIIAPEGCREKLQNIQARLRTMHPGDEKELGGFTVQAIAAYNVNKKFHPKEKGWLGYVVDLDGVSVYVAGDTDLIDEMKDLSVDIALLPVSGTYVMTPKEAAQAAKLVKAKKAIPMHYGDIVGDISHAEEFKKLVGKAAVILEKE